jgi:hypothetical protein
VLYEIRYHRTKILKKLIIRLKTNKNDIIYNRNAFIPTLNVR